MRRADSGNGVALKRSDSILHQVLGLLGVRFTAISQSRHLLSSLACVGVGSAEHLIGRAAWGLDFGHVGLLQLVLDHAERLVALNHGPHHLQSLVVDVVVRDTVYFEHSRVEGLLLLSILFFRPVLSQLMEELLTLAGMFVQSSGRVVLLGVLLVPAIQNEPLDVTGPPFLVKRLGVCEKRPLPVVVHVEASLPYLMVCVSIDLHDLDSACVLHDSLLRVLELVPLLLRVLLNSFQTKSCVSGPCFVQSCILDGADEVLETNLGPFTQLELAPATRLLVNHLHLVSFEDVARHFTALDKQSLLPITEASLDRRLGGHKYDASLALVDPIHYCAIHDFFVDLVIIQLVLQLNFSVVNLFDYTLGNEHLLDDIVKLLDVVYLDIPLLLVLGLPYRILDDSSPRVYLEVLHAFRVHCKHLFRGFGIGQLSSYFHLLVLLDLAPQALQHIGLLKLLGLLLEHAYVLKSSCFVYDWIIVL